MVDQQKATGCFLASCLFICLFVQVYSHGSNIYLRDQEITKISAKGKEKQKTWQKSAAQCQLGFIGSRTALTVHWLMDKGGGKETLWR